MTQPARPAAPRFQAIQPANFPELLRPQRRWLCWKAGPCKANGKFDKFPVDPSTGRKINGRDPSKWLFLGQALAPYLAGAVDGIGFALSDAHPIMVDGAERYVTVADFDHCGARMDEIHTLWLELGKPWTELSPSKKGLHMWGLSCSPLKGGNAGDGRELYSGGRFMTMTGIDAIGTFGGCSGFAALEQQWFPPRAMLPGVPTPPSDTGVADFPSNLVFGQTGEHWFDRLSPADKNACLIEMLRVPAVVALADTSDGDPSPNWRTIVAACARSGASDAYGACREWAQTSPRFDPDNFDLRWRSYRRG